MNWKDLHKQPNGVVFCEDDLPTAPLFIKRESVEMDILVEPIFDLDDGRRRMGWQEMDDCTRNSLQYHVLTQAERDRSVLKLIGPYVLSA